MLSDNIVDKCDDTGDGGLRMKDLSIQFRDTEIKFLKQFIGPKACTPYPSLFIYGHTSTGKTFVTSKLMQSSGAPYVWINCHEAYNASSLFMNITQKLSFPNEAKKVNNVCEFVNFIKNELENNQNTTYLVFDSAEVLRKEDSLLLSVLTRLQELTRVNICSIFISELPWFKFRNHITSFNPASIHFPNYTKDQMCSILQLDCPKGFDASFYDGYVNVIMKTFYTVTRNLSELRHLARINFDKYYKPLDDDSDTEVTSLRLYKNIEPTLREAMRSVYLREVSGTKWKAQSSNIQSAFSDKYSATRELPFYSKFLLLAAYFASYNAPKSDFRHFVKNQGKQSKKKITKKIEKNRHLLGPKPFSLDRLLSIFFSIVGERVLPSALIFSQISSLVNMKLLSRVSADEQLDCPKYKCLAELNLVCKIGKTVNIDVMGYLDDFL